MGRARLLLRFAVLVLAVGLVSAALWRGLLRPRPASSLEDGDFGPVADFRLTERSGRTVSLADLKGKLWVADFVFTRCMGPCPLLSKTMAGLAADTDGAPDVRLVSFTVDPAHDSPRVLAEYADRFGADKARWLFLTGDTAAVHDVILGSFKSALQENGPARPGEEVTHSLNFVLVDKAGRIRGYFDATSAEALERLKKRLVDLL